MNERSGNESLPGWPARRWSRAARRESARTARLGYSSQMLAHRPPPSMLAPRSGLAHHAILPGIDREPNQIEKNCMMPLPDVLGLQSGCATIELEFKWLKRRNHERAGTISRLIRAYASTGVISFPGPALAWAERHSLHSCASRGRVAARGRYHATPAEADRGNDRSCFRRRSSRRFTSHPRPSESFICS